jgi:hypothetical protein
MEIWKDIKGYEGIYKVNYLGIVIRIGGSVKRKEHLMYVPLKIMKPIDNGKGYLRIKLTINNKEKRIMLHRIIAEAFIPNPYNKKCVNHIDGNKNNNSLSNLEWCTHKENSQHSIMIGTFHINHPNKLKTKKLNEKESN